MWNVLGRIKTREEVLKDIKSDLNMYFTFLEMKPEFQENFLEFCMGVRGVKMCYDPFFKHIFDAKLHSGRLSELLSQIIGGNVTVKSVLPKEYHRISEKGPLLILDVIVELESGELADVEIQKMGCHFPGQRATWYASDMVMRQYERVRSKKGKKFSYKDLKKVYVIVIMEKSCKEFKTLPDKYIHRGRWGFDTGLELDLLQEFIFVSLDVFMDLTNNKNVEVMDELDAWLYFLGSDRLEDIQKVISNHPKFKQIYNELIYFRYHPEEAIQMFSEALRILDENTVKYMIEELDQKLEEKDKELEEKIQKLKEKTQKLEEKDKEIERLNKLLAEK